MLFCCPFCFVFFWFSAVGFFWGGKGNNLRDQIFPLNPLFPLKPAFLVGCHLWFFFNCSCFVGVLFDCLVLVFFPQFFFLPLISFHVSSYGLLSPFSLLNSSMTLVALPGLGRTANFSSLWYFSLWSELITAFIYQQGVTRFKVMSCFTVFLWTCACAFHSKVVSDTYNKLKSLGICFLLGQWWISKFF